MTSITDTNFKQVDSELPGYALAREILGADFLSPEEVANSVKGIIYTDEQLIHFGDTLPTQDILKWCRDNSMMLVPGPPTAMTMLDVRDVHYDFFFHLLEREEDIRICWYDDTSQKFACIDKVEALTWIAFRKELVEDSLDKTWEEQVVLVLDPMMVPNAAEVTWALTTYKAVRDICLFEWVHVRTSSLDAGGCHVVIGGFDTDGLSVGGSFEDIICIYDLGLSAARKF